MDYFLRGKDEIELLHKIYSNDIPDILCELINTNAMLRLSGIGQHCGVDYVEIPMLKYKYFFSRLDHSIGTALIIWNFTKDIKMSIAGLFHDISSIVFAHVGDFMKKDYLNQEATEKGIEDIVVNSKDIMSILKKVDIKVDEIKDYKIYSLADNKTPKLCADRLECTLHYPLIRGDISLKEIKEIYSNIIVVPDENNMYEFCFKDIDIAKKFCRISLHNGKLDSSNEDKFVMQFLADILIFAKNNNIISERDLYILSEQEVINKLKSCDNDIINKAWNNYINLDFVLTSKIKPENLYCVNMKVKKRYVNPLVKNNVGIYRLSKISKEIDEEINNFINDIQENYIYSKFKF